jgi:hypothetical protein
MRFFSPAAEKFRHWSKSNQDEQTQRKQWIMYNDHISVKSGAKCDHNQVSVAKATLEYLIGICSISSFGSWSPKVFGNGPP